MAERESLTEKLAALRSAYAQGLPERMKRIEGRWTALCQQWNEEELAQLHREVHGLTGSGATLGYKQISQRARPLEQTLKIILNNAANRPDAETIQHVYQRMARLVDVVSRIDPAEVAGGPVDKYVRDQTRRPNRLVYLLEDDQALSAELSLQLGYFGYQLQAFDTPAGLEQALRQAEPGAIIADVILPGGELEGIDSVRRLRQELHLQIPVIFLTARTDMEARLQAVRAGGAAYLTKPVDVGDLVDRLDEMTSRMEPEPYRILIVDDEPVLAEHYSLTLENAGMATQVVTDPMQVLDALTAFSPELILMDIFIPQCNGTELAAVIRQQEAYLGIPIVYLSTEHDLAMQMAALEQGGDDFLTKPISPQYLIAAVRNRAKRSRILNSLMKRDGLTGLLNHTTITEELVMAVARASRSRRSLYFAMIDIDHFKQVNDSYGHPTGDRVIKSLARLLQQRLRQTDMIGRFGGEEFAVILADTDREAAQRLMEGIREDFGNLRQQHGETEFRVTLSCGLAAYRQGITAAMLTSTADQALYRAKQNGRNRVVVSD